MTVLVADVKFLDAFKQKRQLLEIRYSTIDYCTLNSLMLIIRFSQDIVQRSTRFLTYLPWST